MVTVTQEAIALLGAIRSDVISQMSPLPTDQPAPALRLIIQQGQAGLALDLPRAGDQVVEQDGQAILLIDTEVGELLSGATLAVQATPQGDQLTLVPSTEDEGAE
ncbi:MAG: hypothetical protein HY689_03755 [Chloroflexi bacterium]|nr:hypothetical protein [Chloroflexota bacterium]